MKPSLLFFWSYMIDVRDIIHCEAIYFVISIYSKQPQWENRMITQLSETSLVEFTRLFKWPGHE
jgi:hypothetical protein